MTTNDGASVTTKSESQANTAPAPTAPRAGNHPIPSHHFHHKSNPFPYCLSKELNIVILNGFLFCLRESRATIIRDLNSLGRYLGIHPLQYAPCLSYHNTTPVPRQSAPYTSIHPPWCRVRVQGMLPRKRAHSCVMPPFFTTRVMSEPSIL